MNNCSRNDFQKKAEIKKMMSASKKKTK